MITSYQVIVECDNDKDEEKYGRTLYFKSYDSALATFKVLVEQMLKLDIIDPYRIQYWYPGDDKKPDGILKSQFVRYPTP